MKPVVIYTSANCAYCVTAKALLDKKGVSYQEIRIDLEPERREEMLTRAKRHTVPQIFIGDHHVGGCDDLRALEKSGQLDELLKSK